MMGISCPLTLRVSPVSNSAVRSPLIVLTSMAFGDFFPFTLLRITIMSDVTAVPPKVLLFIRNAPTKSEPPSLTIQSRSFLLLSSVPLEEMNMPIPPSRNLRTFLAIQKSCMLWNFFDRSLSPVVSSTRRPVTNGTLVMARSTLPLGMRVCSKPCISTFASG